ncbi:MAG: nucleotidyltransferase domain-containing protein [Lentisphaerae bacterium]|nr:nucleotidyltransferase domain-containing protein [Lentisphaerota bacterium]
MTTTIAETKIASGDLEPARGVARNFAAEARLHFGARLKAMRLYGSAARGDWSTESDIDVLVLLDRVESADGDWLSSRAVRLGVLDSGFILQPLFMSEADFNALMARERLFAREVRQNGIDL